MVRHRDLVLPRSGVPVKVWAHQVFHLKLVCGLSIITESLTSRGWKGAVEDQGGVLGFQDQQQDQKTHRFHFDTLLVAFTTGFSVFLMFH